MLKTAQKVAGRKPVLLTVNEAGTREAATLAKRAAKAGANGLMVVPSPDLPHQSGRDGRDAVARWPTAGDLPVMIYSNRLAYRVDVTIADHGASWRTTRCFVAIKESSDDIRRSTDIINRFGDRFDLFTGVDNLAFEALSVGAIGWVAGLVIAFPKETVAIYQLMKAGPPRRGAGDLPLVPPAARPRCLDLSGPEHQAGRGAARSAPTTGCACRASRCRAIVARRSRRSSVTLSRRGPTCRGSRLAKAA